MSTMMVACGNVNFTHLSRYSHLSERTIRRHYHRGLGLESLNQALMASCTSPQNVQILAVDATFVSKSGRHTDGLDQFYNSKSGRAEKGVEWSVIAVVDVEQNTAYSLSAQQTPAGLSTSSQPQPSDESSPSGNRLDFYLGYLADTQPYVPESITYVVADRYYSKRKWVCGVRKLGWHCIGKLRRDAALKHLYEGPQKRRGRPRLYEGKVNVHDPSRLEWVAQVDEHTQFYTAVVYSVSFKGRVRLAYVQYTRKGHERYMLLFSTDLSLDAMSLYRYYQARFQIEFVFRDAKQCLGLADAQARSEVALDTHVNVCLSALNLLKADLRRGHSLSEPLSFSVASYKRRALNEHLLNRFSAELGISLKWIKSRLAYRKLLDYGTIAA
ncbi:MAG: transposase [Cyanobacteria bacterium P01_F01_bin.33]